MSELRFMTSAELSQAVVALERAPTVDAWLEQLDRNLPLRREEHAAVPQSVREQALRCAALKLRMAETAFLESAKSIPEFFLQDSAASFHSTVQTVHTRRVENIHHCIEMLGRCGRLIQVRSNDAIVKAHAQDMHDAIGRWQGTPKDACTVAGRAHYAQTLLRTTLQLKALGYVVRAAVASLETGSCLTAIVILQCKEDEASPLCTMVVPRTLNLSARKSHREVRPVMAHRSAA